MRDPLKRERQMRRRRHPFSALLSKSAGESAIFAMLFMAALVLTSIALRWSVGYAVLPTDGRDLSSLGRVMTIPNPNNGELGMASRDLLPFKNATLLGATSENSTFKTALTIDGRSVGTVSTMPESPSHMPFRTSHKQVRINLATEQEDIGGDSTTATVMGMATGYKLSTFERFVGTLRKSGYKGHIILGVQQDVSEEVLDYFEYRNVTPKILSYVSCTYNTNSSKRNEKGNNNHNNIKNANESKEKKKAKEPDPCAQPYPDIKLRWSRYPLQRDWLEECSTCTGPVLITDVRDTFFQRDPFGPGSPTIRGLQVFQEHPSQTTDHWLTKWPLKACKGLVYDPPKPMLCSGTTVGTRSAMVRYLNDMYAEMKVWISNPACHFGVHGDDQSIHNYLYYSGRLPYATSIPNRAGGIVNTVGKQGAMIVKEHRKKLMENFNMSHGAAMGKPFDGSDGKKRWIGEKFNLTDADGWFTEADGSRSRVIHQYDRFGRPFLHLWMEHRKGQRSYFRDPIPQKV